MFGKVLCLLDNDILHRQLTTSFCNNDCLLGGMSVLHSYIIGCFITIREGKPNSQVELIHENSNGEA